MNNNSDEKLRDSEQCFETIGAQNGTGCFGQNGIWEKEVGGIGVSRCETNL